MLKVWGRRNSQNVQKVMWLVGELGLEHEHIPAGGAFGRVSEPAFRKLNPNQLVPVVEDGDAVIWESHAILRYLASVHGAAALWPADPYQRSLADRWLDWNQAHWQPAFLSGVFWGFYRTPEAERDAGAVAQSIARCSSMIRWLDRQLAGRSFLAGERFTLADIPLGSTLFRYFGLEIERPSVPNVEAWYARLCERAPYREHVMIPFDDLKGRLAF